MKTFDEAIKLHVSGEATDLFLANIDKTGEELYQNQDFHRIIERCMNYIKSGGQDEQQREIRTRAAFAALFEFGMLVATTMEKQELNEGLLP